MSREHDHGCSDNRREVVELVEAVLDLACCRCGRRGCPDHDGHDCHDGGHHGGTEDDGGGKDGGQGGHRPGRHPGKDTGGLDGPLEPGEVTTPVAPGEWKGPRKDQQLPFLFLRANPGDTGTRPVVGPFWESPDVYILAGTAPSAAPAVPPQLGQTALAGTQNTVYAHVWNLGLGPAREVVVEFYWCDPSLGFNPVGAHLIGSTVTWLGKRSDPDCHKVVKCPTPWIPTFVNGGHECLLVRAFDVAGDPLTTPEWDASINRHLGQRNIHVAQSGDATGPLTLSVGQLFGGEATVRVERHAPTTMPWLQLHSGERGAFPGQALPTGALVLGEPGTNGGTTPVTTTGDGAQVVFAAGDEPPAPGQAHVYRVTAEQDGAVIGGYTVVHLG